MDRKPKAPAPGLPKKFSDRYLDLLIAGGVHPEDLPPDLKGNPVHIPQVNFDVPLEQKLRAKMGPPSYAVRAKFMEEKIEELRRELEEQYAKIAQKLKYDPDRFARVWRAIIESLDLSDLNRLISEHNRFYPIEANLRDDPETGQIMIGNTPWKPQPLIKPERLLTEFPDRLPQKEVPEES